MSNTWTPTSSGGGGGGSPHVVYASVNLITADISPWDGSAIQFNNVTTDADSLWDAATFKYVIKVAGWYQVTAYSTGGSGGVEASQNATQQHSFQATNSGAGANIFNHVESAATGFFQFPPLVGETHCAVGDSLLLEGDGGATWTVYRGFTFAIRLIDPT